MTMNPGKPVSAHLANELAEVLELKLLGAETVGDRSWDDHAHELLEDYHRTVNKTITSYKPLWRSLHEAYSLLDKTDPPYLIFSHIITAFCNRIEHDFPVHEIDREVLLGYLREESQKALICE